MRCEEVEKIQQACTQHSKKVKPNAFWKALGMFEPHFEDMPIHSIASLNNEERKAVEAHKLEVERKRSEAIMHARHITWI